MMHRLFEHIMNKCENKVQHIRVNDNNNKIIIYQSELDYLSKCILESPRLETGGNLFGLWTPFGIPLIHYVVGPGPKAMHHSTHFRQDFDFLEKNADLLVKEHALHHIGSWHSHHSLGLAQPSDGDTESTFSGMRECNLDSFVLLIGNYRQGKSTINAFRYYSNGEIVKLKWIILQGQSPFRKAYDKKHFDLVYIPVGESNMMPLEQSSLIGKEQITTQVPTFESGYWLSLPENRKELAIIVKFLKTQFASVCVFQLDGSTVEIRVNDSYRMSKFVFDKSFPKDAPKVFVSKSEGISVDTSTMEWNVGERNISEAFIHFFKTIRL